MSSNQTFVTPATRSFMAFVSIFRDCCFLSASKFSIGLKSRHFPVHGKPRIWRSLEVISRLGRMLFLLKPPCTKLSLSMPHCSSCTSFGGTNTPEHYIQSVLKRLYNMDPSLWFSVCSSHKTRGCSRQPQSGFHQTADHLVNI